MFSLPPLPLFPPVQVRAGPEAGAPVLPSLSSFPSVQILRLLLFKFRGLWLTEDDGKSEVAMGFWRTVPAGTDPQDSIRERTHCAHPPVAGTAGGFHLGDR